MKLSISLCITVRYYLSFNVCLRCLAAKGEDSGECEKFAKYYRSICPGEWVSSMVYIPLLVCF